MAKWFAKYGFPIAAIYLVKPKGGATIKTSADVELIKLGETKLQQEDLSLQSVHNTDQFAV